MAYITAKDLTVGYEDGVVASHIDFTVKAGDYLAIVGENGSGKSTLMKTILGLVPPLSGELSYGDGITHRQIGYLPQATDVQRDFPASVEEIVISGCQARLGFSPFYKREDRELAAKNMERMRITDLRKKSFKKLSGGQQQRVLLARALCAADKLLLLDEPVAGLDPKVSEQMYELLCGLNKEGVTIMMISHDIREVGRYASHILSIGEKNRFGAKEDFEEMWEKER